MTRTRKALEKLKAWTPEAVPLQFTAKYNPYNYGARVKDYAVAQQELDEDRTAPFFTESYLYNLLGKEDARTLLALLHQVERAVLDDETEREAKRIGARV